MNRTLFWVAAGIVVCSAWAGTIGGPLWVIPGCIVGAILGYIGGAW